MSPLIILLRDVWLTPISAEKDLMLRPLSSRMPTRRRTKSDSAEFFDFSKGILLRHLNFVVHVLQHRFLDMVHRSHHGA